MQPSRLLSPPPAGRLPGLDLLRAIAIAWVMLFHLLRWEGFSGPLATLAELGWMGVDLFFVLSGFLIGTQLLRSYASGGRPALADFYSRRFFRVVPAFLAVLALYFLVPAFREAPGISPLWYFLTFTNNFLIDYAHNKAFSHVWSLCVEEHFYLLLPLLAQWLMIKPSVKKATLFALSLLGLGILLRAATWLYVLQPHLPNDPQTFGLLFVERIYYPSYNRLDGLLVGVVLAGIKVFRPNWWRAAMQHGYSLLLAGGAILALACYICLDRVSFAAVTFGFPLLSAGLGLILLACVSDNCLLATRRLPGMAPLATLAFSLYLSHKAVYHLLNTYQKHWLEQGGMAVYAIATLAAAACLYCLVERPFLRWRDRLSQRRLDRNGQLGLSV
ncbi:acyltransferase [Chitinimonas arctica]|uniref:Acyltransferase n=1 Tax=Chitinimonas arctica TaxID=2594795 RepID=A0A516SDF3_9NEIS|nr:acyltransferase [Chitinimonas arctica]QDQ26068.1 acyltransferase [Chitinimonas arctica]